MEEEEKFSNFSLKDKTIIISIIALFLIIFLAFIFFVYVGIFQITGIEYSSRTALLLFFLFILLLDGITYFILIFFKVLLYPMTTNMPNWLSLSLFSIIEITLDWFVIHTADDWIESVQMSNIAELCVVLFLFILNKLLSDKTE
ncbi:regulatory YrvL family protein [Bacillus paramycoides]|uniref:Regulatory YrvL family protein n=1 Tax=Bacillus paramycoides TaxID=2026194 RepID=A0ABU6N2Z6_9BACI|nr:regulatory YrvL family protein [Bacillus paramycoides]MED0970347.1 regulatory YrvL family protein [Bacillus paramycoides]MED0980717.1 regulatory YrvL family protein [Bacillus paramycoides]MED0985809.1 regulatory YrvL family protein [Bacillus paramycoides]MED1091757.1 regulatory YrvL family protein [Bacillus paramycoides]MED1104788.1 regulatory YrvL family protein [Bacillus paramycoides]